MASSTRWYLKRSQGHIFLVVEEHAEPHRGVQVTVRDRHDAREFLPQLRQWLADRIAMADRPVRTYDPVEADERA